MSPPGDPLATLEHRPWPRPAAPWALAMRWERLLFLHWPLPAETLTPHLPAGVELDTFDGRAWLGVVPFEMRGVRPRGVPVVPGVSDFPELNLRTYVTAPGPDGAPRPGVWFFSLDAASWLGVRLARAFFHLPYFDARMRVQRDGEVTRYRSERTHQGVAPAVFAGSYRPTGRLATKDPLERFLTERYCLYSADRGGRVWRGEIHHVPWPLQGAEVELEACEMTGLVGGGIGLPAGEAVAHYSERLEVVAWLPVRGGG